MKKQLLILSLAGLFSLTACGKSSRELTPVEDVTGLDRAAAILEKEEEIMQQVTDNPANFFNYFPNKFTLTINATLNGKERIMVLGEGIQVIERTMDNVSNGDLKIEINHDNLQLHAYQSYDPTHIIEYNSFYDETSGTFYFLTNYVGTKIKVATKVANRDEAKACFYEYCDGILGSYVDYLLPISYLANITEKNEENEYKLLNTYKDIQTEYFDRFGNDNEYLKHRFGSNDESSFSLKNDLRINANYLPVLDAPEIIASGYMEGANSAYYNTMLQEALGNYTFSSFGLPDLIVFENNYLSYALFTRTINAQSASQMGMSEGALYQHTTEKTEISFTKDKADITNPNPSDYTEYEELE
ncbi:MAG: hypothetical protein MJ213_01125 [Bacilli bacterium]|nr:hypothetical protein [Bacilli bacterium]